MATISSQVLRISRVEERDGDVLEVDEWMVEFAIKLRNSEACIAAS